MERPFDLGPEVTNAADIRVGSTYYFTDAITPLTKVRVVRLFPGSPLGVNTVSESGVKINVDVKPGNPSWTPRFYFVDQRPLQREVGRLLVKKIPNISTQPGTGPANTIRNMLGVQPKRQRGGSRRRTRVRSTRTRRQRRRS